MTNSWAFEYTCNVIIRAIALLGREIWEMSYKVYRFTSLIPFVSTDQWIFLENLVEGSWVLFWTHLTHIICIHILKPNFVHVFEYTYLYCLLFVPLLNFNSMSAKEYVPCNPQAFLLIFFVQTCNFLIVLGLCIATLHNNCTVYSLSSPDFQGLSYLIHLFIFFSSFKYNYQIFRSTVHISMYNIFLKAYHHFVECCHHLESREKSSELWMA